LPWEILCRPAVSVRDLRKLSVRIRVMSMCDNPATVSRTPRTRGSPSIPDAVDKKVARAFLTRGTKGSPSIPARPYPLKNTGNFKDDEKFVPGLKPRLRLLSKGPSMCQRQRSTAGCHAGKTRFCGVTGAHFVPVGDFGRSVIGQFVGFLVPFSAGEVKKCLTQFLNLL